jgi:hypothetical protein
VSVLSTCVTKQTRDMRYSEAEPDVSSWLTRRPSMRQKQAGLDQMVRERRGRGMWS